MSAKREKTTMREGRASATRRRAGTRGAATESGPPAGVVPPQHDHAHPPEASSVALMSRAMPEEDYAAEVLSVPMLEEPTHLPLGRRRASFSPLAFYALTRVERSDVDATDEGLWLVEEPCPKVTPTGITLLGQEFFDPRLQELVAGLPGAAAPRLVVRYNRALLARGVLREVIVGERDEAKRFHERLRCSRRADALPAATVDLNVVLRERAIFKRVLEAKVALANETRITLERGTAAIEALRNEQAARLRRQRREERAPLVAKPIDARSERERAQREASERTTRLADDLRDRTTIDLPDDDQAPADASTGGRDHSQVSTAGVRERRPRVTRGPVAQRADRTGQAVAESGPQVSNDLPDASDDGSSPGDPGSGRRRRHRTRTTIGAKQTEDATARAARSDKVDTTNDESLSTTIPAPTRTPVERARALAERLGGRVGFDGSNDV